jgi:hypothetical protein
MSNTTPNSPIAEAKAILERASRLLHEQLDVADAFAGGVAEVGRPSALEQLDRLLRASHCLEDAMDLLTQEENEDAERACDGDGSGG